MLQRMADKHHQMRRKLMAKIIAKACKMQTEANNDPKKGMRNMSRKVDGPKASPLRYVKRDANASSQHKAGTITTKPAEIDGIVRRAWKRIYDGNTDDAAAVVRRFITKYSKYIFRVETQNVDHITKEMVHVVSHKKPQVKCGHGRVGAARVRIHVVAGM